MKKKSEISNVNFGDKRLNKRFGLIIEKITKSPNSSIPEACISMAEIKGAYRFFDSDKVKVEEIQESIYRNTIEQIKGEAIILTAQDTSNLDFSSHKKIKGTGYLDTKNTKGIKMHSSLAISRHGVPLGLIHQKFWVRDIEEFGKKTERKNKKINEKESHRWIETLKFTQERIKNPIKIVIIGDRESDIYDLFLQERREGCDFLIRASQNRVTNDEPKLLFDNILNTEVKGFNEIKVKRADDRKERDARLAVRFKEIEIQPPCSRKKENLPSIKLNVILVDEIDPPDDATKISWLLLTTLPLNTFEDAIQYIYWYSLRWLIERYHYVLKSGCQVEELQLEEADRIKRAVAVYCIVALRLLFLTYTARINPDQSCSTVLEKYEWESLHCFINKSNKAPSIPPTLKEAVWMIANLGGFLGRKSDGSPGVKVLWRGIKRLNDISQAYLVFNKDVGNA